MIKGEGYMVRLEFFNPSDFSQLIKWSGDEKFLLQWAGPQFKFPLSEEQLEKYIEGSNDILNSDRLIYKTVDSATETVIGHISLGNIDKENLSARIGKVLIGSTSMRGKGIGHEMIKQILWIGFHELKLHRISLGVFDFNEGAIKCYEKLGFSREGLLRDVRKFKNTYWNLVEMSILEDEWRKIY
jgi:RimJ/RimL family protein N-acetyltransferase